ncbi:hypothetical protein V8C35DRAFT_292042 [Trichoderma chlorosporum]
MRGTTPITARGVRRLTPASTPVISAGMSLKEEERVSGHLASEPRGGKQIKRRSMNAVIRPSRRPEAVKGAA